jgi:hypothetical protein
LQTAATEFLLFQITPTSDVYAANGTTNSRETNHGSFGEGFRTELLEDTVLMQE